MSAQEQPRRCEFSSAASRAAMRIWLQGRTERALRETAAAKTQRPTGTEGAR